MSETTILSYTTDFRRFEEYQGFGLNVDFLVTDRLTLNLDYAESETTRTETDVELRLGASDNNLVGGNRDDFMVQLDTQVGDGVAIATILDDGGNGFEVTDPSYFNARDRGRVRAREIPRENTLDAIRADLTWDVDMGDIHTIKMGTRRSSMAYSELGGLRNAPGLSLFEDEDLVSPNGVANNDVTDAILGNVLACANSQFPESGFLSNLTSGNVISNASSGSSVSEYATFNFDCAVDAWLVNYGGQSAIQFQDGITSGQRPSMFKLSLTRHGALHPSEVTLACFMLILRSLRWDIAVPLQSRRLMALGLSLLRVTPASRVSKLTPSEVTTKSGFQASLLLPI